MILLDRSRQVPDWEKNQGNKLSIQPVTSCPRCSGLLIPDFAAGMDRYDGGKPVTFRYCVNCGNCINLEILTNRGKRPQSVRSSARRARPPLGPPRSAAM